MNKDQAGFGSLVAGFYAWIVTVFFGSILLDIVYSNFLNGLLSASERTPLFSDVSDLLLRIGFVTGLASLGAIASSWRSPSARNLFIASLLFLAFEFAIPMFFSPFIESVETLNLGPLLRIIPSGLASMLALAGLYNYSR